MTTPSSHPALSATDSLANSMSDIILLLGRILLGWVFVRSGFPKMFDIAHVAASFPPRGIPAFMAYISVPVEFFGGLALIFGLATRYVSLLFVVFILVATFSSHRYWNFPAAQQVAQASNFYKNLGILGGVFFLFAVGPGRLSFDSWLGGRT
ncbi:MAG TPA: DoxX family protein [Pseudolabrys sp.]|nr:DoxX family protein [Pseudolabrys sp.]